MTLKPSSSYNTHIESLRLVRDWELVGKLLHYCHTPGHFQNSSETKIHGHDPIPLGKRYLSWEFNT